VQSDDRLDMMALFLKIAETGRLAEASRQLDLSQPSASRMLRRLERRLNAELVRRSTQGLALTDAGRQFADMARAMLDQWRHAAETLDGDPANLAGLIRIMAPVALGQNLLASIFAAFGRQHPGVTIDCHLRDDAVDLPSQGFDLQIRAGPVLNQSLIVRELWEIERTVVAAPGHPAVAHPSELSRHPAVRLTPFVPATMEMTRAGGETTVLRHSSAFTTDNLYATLTAVREGLGFAVLPLWATQPLIEAGDLVRLCPEWHPPNVVLSLVYPPSPLRPRRLDALLRFLRHELTAEAGLGIAFLESSGARSTVRTKSAPTASGA
jgi:DNA-binding transcriptional LysR family regulator